MEKAKPSVFFKCSFNPNNSSLPANVNYIIDKRLRTMTFSAENIEEIFIQTTSMDIIICNVSIGMLKTCGEFICIPLEMILKQVLLTGVFPSEWEKGNIVRNIIRETNDTLKVIFQFLFFKFVVKYFKNLF